MNSMSESSNRDESTAAWTPYRHDGKLVVRGWYLDDIRTRAESSRLAGCTRTACLEPEANELAEFVLGLLDVIEGLDRAYLEALDAAK